MNEQITPPIITQPLKTRVQNFIASVPEPYAAILRYFFPEFVVALVLYTMIGLIDAQCIAHLKSTACYASLGVANTLTFFINKLAEGISVGAVILCGQYQGQKQYEMVGRSLVAALWATACVGFFIAAFFYFDAQLVCQWLRIPESVAVDCIPYLKVRAVGIFFMFLFSALIGFLRGVKNTRAGMYCFVIGACSFVFFDYALIFGMFGFSARGFQGSAMAFALQYIIMFSAACIYILSKKEYRVYRIRMFQGSWSLIRSVMKLSIPVTFDKAALQVERLWMVRLIAPMGSVALSSMNVIKDMETLAFVPAIAFAHVMTLMASNEFGAQHFESVKKITKTIFIMAAVAVGCIAALLLLNSQAVIGIFDRQHVFMHFAVQVFPIAILLIGCDLAQLILAGALRGTGNVAVVMWVRVISAFCCFIPLSYFGSLLPFTNPITQFVVVYGSFNVVNGLSSLAYLYWFSSGKWLRSSIVKKKE